MNVIIAGSPRKGRYSDRIAEKIKETIGGEIIHARDLSVGQCIACGYCKGKGNGSCFQKDDMQDVLGKVREAERVIIVSPIYWWQLTGTIKPIIDRLYALRAEEWKGKKLAFVLNGSETNENDREYALLRDQGKEMADYIQAEYAFLGVGTADDEEEAFSRTLEKVRDFALTL